MSQVAERILWAVDLLDVQPGDHVIEIGGGAGIAASLIVEKLDRGTFTGLDRSAAMTAQAIKRNQTAVQSRKATFVAAPVDSADFGGKEYDKIFLVNVNLHLHDAAGSFNIIRSWLAPGGTLVAVSHPPAEQKALDYAVQMPAILKDSGFDRVDVVSKRLSAGLATAVIASAPECR